MSISLHIEAGVLRVRLGGWDPIYALRGRIDVPLDEIADVRVAPRDEVPRSGLRVMGTSFPGLIRAGSFGFGAQRDFWDVRRGRELLVISVQPGQRYRRIILEVTDPQGELRRLQAAIGG